MLRCYNLSRGAIRNYMYHMGILVIACSINTRTHYQAQKLTSPCSKYMVSCNQPGRETQYHICKLKVIAGNIAHNT